MRWSICPAMAACVLMLASGAPVSARQAETPAPRVTPDQVDAAIKKGIAFLYAQHKNGNWEEGQSDLSKGRKKTGQTALVIYALMSCGEDAHDPRTKAAIDYLIAEKPVGTFALGMRLNAFSRLPRDPAVLKAMQTDAKVLIGAQRTAGEDIGTFDPKKTNTQGSTAAYNVEDAFSILGLWSASDQLEVPGEFWTRLENRWRRKQSPEGSWDFDPLHPDPLGVTVTGLSTLFVTQDFLSTRRGLDCTGNINSPTIDKAFDWLTQHIREAFSSGSSFTALYNIERLGDASGYKYVGDCNWYEEGASSLVARQKGGGGWGPKREQYVGDTALALIFLARGRQPIVMAKLQYDMPAAVGADASAEKPAANWNQRTRDLANVTTWIGRQVERELNWRIVNLNAPLSELHESPVLYISGNQSLKMTDEQKAKLRAFAMEGGLIVGNADCANKEFTSGFTELGKSLFPGYEFRPLPADHPILANEQFVASKWKRPLTLLGLSNGVRELMLLIPDADPARAWQMNNVGGKEELFQVAANIYLYAVDKRAAQFKGITHIVTADTKVKTTKTIEVARIKYAGNWDPEPAGWQRLAAILNNKDKIALKTNVVELGKSQLKGVKLAHITGTTAVKFSDAARKELQEFTKAGGTLVIDAAGGSRDFAQSIENEMESVYGAPASQLSRTQIDPEHELYKTDAKGLAEVGYRDFAKKSLSGDVKKPRLHGVEVDGRVTVIYSPEDLSAGMVGQPVDGIIGYSPRSATALMRSIVLFTSK